jgi:hypothetical protein
MQLIIHIDDEYARQLALIQKQTNQDHTTVIQQGIGLYYQQVQPYCQIRSEIARQSNPSDKTPTNIQSIN